MGKIGDVSGKVGDVSGKVGDVSGEATFEQVYELLMQDRRSQNLGCLESRVNRLEFEIVALARWFELRLLITQKSLMDKINAHTIALDNHEARIDALEPDEYESPERPRKLPRK